MRRKYSEKSKEGGVCIAERGGRGQYIIQTRETQRKKGENINMKNNHVSVEEEGKSPHRQLYK